MKILTLDFETEFSDDYTLKKMTTEAYIRDERFQAHGAAIRWPTTEQTTWYTDAQLRDVFKEIDWSSTALLAHHAHFEGLILSHHYDVRPCFWFDTLSMGRMMLGNHLSVALDALAKHFGLAGKTVPYHLFKGRRWDEITSDVQATIAEGCCHDVQLTWQLFQILAQTFPRGEYELVDMTVRMFTEPKLIGDIDLLADIWREEANKKQTMLDELGITAEELQSADRFKTLLEAEGVEIEYKDGKNGAIPAFAKNDDFMKELLDDDNERVGALATARLGIKSTALQSRAETIGWMARRGPLAIYLRFAGAATTRWAGGDASNFQNLKRGHRIRSSLTAPDGYLFAAPDASQIECRFLNYLAGQWDVIERFRNGEDPYVGIAAQFYGRPIGKADTNERGTGKQAELSCGYGCGGAKFQRTAALGIYGPPVKLTEQEARGFVDLYRATHNAVVAYWRQADAILGYLKAGNETQWGPVTVKDHRIWLPNGAPLIYDTLEIDEFGEWRVRTRHGWQKMYGAKLVENVIQAIARVHIGECMKTIAREGLSIVGMSHDELWVLIPEGEGAEQDLQFCLDVIGSSPSWLPDVPLAAEGKMDKRYPK